MTFAVLWTPIAESRLAHLWTVAANRSAVTAAAHEIDRLLARSPLDQGESRFDHLRVMFEPPLGIEYAVDEDQGLVYVLTVWSFARDKSDR